MVSFCELFFFFFFITLPMNICVFYMIFLCGSKIWHGSELIWWMKNKAQFWKHKIPIIFQISFSCFMFLVNNFYGLFDYYLRIYVDTGYLNIDPMVWFVLWNSKDIMYLSYESTIYCLSFLKFYEMMYFEQFFMIWAGLKCFWIV
jgi:hypothetical protein